MTISLSAVDTRRDLFERGLFASAWSTAGSGNLRCRSINLSTRLPNLEMLLKLIYSTTVNGFSRRSTFTGPQAERVIYSNANNYCKNYAIFTVPPLRGESYKPRSSQFPQGSMQRVAPRAFIASLLARFVVPTVSLSVLLSPHHVHHLLILRAIFPPSTSLRRRLPSSSTNTRHYRFMCFHASLWSSSLVLAFHTTESTLGYKM